MSEPMYRLIADDLRRQIESGKLAPGAQLKSELELREYYGKDQGRMVSRNTVRDAIKLLDARGLVETRPGQGTFVVRKVSPFVSRLVMDPEAGGVEDEVYTSEVRQRGRIPRKTAPRVEVQVATSLVASELELDAVKQVISRHQERSIDGIPWSMQTIFYPKGFADRGAIELLMAANISET